VNIRIFWAYCHLLGQILDEKVPTKCTLSDHLWKYLQKYAKKHRVVEAVSRAVVKAL
jgi:hypothetical protein